MPSPAKTNGYSTANFLVLRTFYRYYYDSFGMDAHIASLDMGFITQ